MDIQKMLYTHNGLYSNKNQTTTVHNNMNEFHEHNKQKKKKKADTKELHIV